MYVDGHVQQSISQSLPPLLRSSSCEWCFKASECFAYHRMAEHGDADSSGVRDMFQHITSDISDAHAAYFRHWDSLIDLEANAESSSSRRLVLADYCESSLATKEDVTGVGGLSVTSFKCLDTEKDDMLTGISTDTNNRTVVQDAWTVSLSRKKRGRSVLRADSDKEIGNIGSVGMGHLAVGDTVTICVEFGRSKGSQCAVVDIEDCSTNISGTELFAARGTVLQLSALSESIIVALKDVSKRFRRFGALDIDCLCAAIRSNRMFIQNMYSGDERNRTE